jgi:hypothetical protein
MPRSPSNLGEMIAHPEIANPFTTANHHLSLHEAIKALNCVTHDSTLAHVMQHQTGEKDILRYGKRVFTGDSVTAWHWCRLQHIRQGACLVVPEAFLDWLFDYDRQILGDYALKVKSLPNPNQVGTLDAFIAWMDVPHATLYQSLPPGHPMHPTDSPTIWTEREQVGVKDCEATHWHTGDGRGWVTFWTRHPFGIVATGDWLRRSLPGYDAAPLPGRTWKDSTSGFAVWPHDPTFTGEKAPAHRRSRSPKRKP